jgi:hypothetical protein
MGCSSGCCLLISSQAISSHYQDLAFRVRREMLDTDSLQIHSLRSTP